MIHPVSGSDKYSNSGEMFTVKRIAADEWLYVGCAGQSGLWSFSQ